MTQIEGKNYKKNAYAKEDRMDPKKMPMDASGWVGACMGALVGGRRHRWSATRFSECPCGGITYLYY